jgi:hypothetical protein
MYGHLGATSCTAFGAASIPLIRHLYNRRAGDSIACTFDLTGEECL